MEDNTINYNLVEIALEKLSGFSFESFANAFFASIFGTSFRPLGGIHDGGADAFQSGKIWEDVEPIGIFYQASSEKDVKGKIRKTHSRLIEFGRSPKKIVYFTPLSVPHIDRVETELTDKLNCSIRIYDKRYIVSHINNNSGTIASYRTFLEPALKYLSQVGGSKLISPSAVDSTPAIYVFLRQEIERHSGSSLVNAITDGLILWSLEGTDPEKNILMSEGEILKKIKESIPSAMSVIKSSLSKRLEKLSKISQSQGRPVRKYTKQQKYCLSYDFRERLKKDNAIDESLKLKVSEIFSLRLTDYAENILTVDEVLHGAEISLEIIQKTFENQGLEFATFISNHSYSTQHLTMADYFDEVVVNYGVEANRHLILKEAVLDNLRNSLYNSTESERLYFARLSATYTLLFCLKSEPRIVEYFQKMAADFYLYVGSDIIVRAISERYLRPEDQITRNTLKLIREAGGKLVLAESVLDEVYFHIKTTNYEFINHYQRIEPSITIEIARQSNRILIRAYFYSKLKPAESIKSPSNWSQFLSQFCDYLHIENEKGREQIRKYLLLEFGMKYEDSEELRSFVTNSQVEDLAVKLTDYKKQQKLAQNDALLTLGVYGRRRTRGELSTVSEYGYRTWWLTQESRILSYTKDIQRKYGAEYIMRPEFLVNFLSFAPSMSDVRKSYSSIFPTILGIRLARRVNNDVLADVLKKVEEVTETEPGRVKAMVSEYSDKLKTMSLQEKPKIQINDFDETP